MVSTSWKYIPFKVQVSDVNLYPYTKDGQKNFELDATVGEIDIIDGFALSDVELKVVGYHLGKGLGVGGWGIDAGLSASGKVGAGGGSETTFDVEVEVTNVLVTVEDNVTTAEPLQQGIAATVHGNLTIENEKAGFKLDMVRRWKLTSG